MRHLHGQGVLHLDLKPDNVSLRIMNSGATPLWRRVEAMLGDWELSSVFEGDGAHLSRGTPGFWSPEQAPRCLDELERLRLGQLFGACLASEGAEHGPSEFSSYWQDLCDDCPCRCAETTLDAEVPGGPTPPSTATAVSAASDVWGWGACALDLLGLLDTMRREGYRAFARSLDPGAPGATRLTAEADARDVPDSSSLCAADGYLLLPGSSADGARAGGSNGDEQGGIDLVRLQHAREMPGVRLCGIDGKCTHEGVVHRRH